MSRLGLSQQLRIFDEIQNRAVALKLCLPDNVLFVKIEFVFRPPENPFEFRDTQRVLGVLRIPLDIPDIGKRKSWEIVQFSEIHVAGIKIDGVIRFFKSKFLLIILSSSICFYYIVIIYEFFINARLLF